MLTQTLTTTFQSTRRGWLMLAIALLLALSLGPIPVAWAANITVTTNNPNINAGDGLCSLIEAIINANNDALTIPDCLAGSGADVITLQAAGPYNVTAINNGIDGLNGLPSITSVITINGNGNVIQRSSGASFRIFHVSASGNLTLNNLTVSNGASGGSFPANAGGGILNRGTVALNNSTVNSNSATFGGGIFNDVSKTLTLTNSTVSTNTVNSGSGGGIYNFSNGTLILTNSTVSGNSVTGNNNGGGGGILNDFGSATLTNSTVSGNSVTNNNNGGGGGVRNINNGTLTLTNSTVSGNSVTGNNNGGGGGVRNFGTLALTNSTVSANSAGTGGGIFNTAGTATLANSIVAAQTAGTNCLGIITPAGPNLASDITCSASIVSGSPGLGPLANNGGPTLTHALLTGSPAIDNGNNGICAAPPVNNLDQRGQPRPVDGDGNGSVICDLGAYELQPGKIIVNKTAVGGNNTFSYTGGGGGGLPANFNITTSTGSGSQTFDSIAPGAKTVTEAAPPVGWDFTSLSCTDPDNGTTVAGQTANIDLDAGETVTCTFTNTKRSSITITKDATPDDPQNFNFIGDLGSFNLDNANPDDGDGISNSQIFSNLTPGNYKVSENVPSGWDLIKIVCDDPDGGTSISLPSVTINLDVGEDITCTFTNEQDANIVVVKETNPDGSSQVFNFSASYDGDGFSLSDGQSNDSGDLDPGVYSVSETTPTGWVLDGATCDDGSSPDEIFLSAGETVTCTFTNIKQPILTLVKSVSNDNGGTAQVSDFILRIDGNAVTSGQANIVSVGSHTASEDAFAGYAASAWGGDCAADGSITLAAGDEATCTITNDDIGPKLVVIKKVVNDGGGTAVSGDFTLEVSGSEVSPASFPGEDTPGTEVSLDAGSYSVSETGGPSGYEASFSADCDGDIDIGETKTCTVTNSFVPPTIKVTKVVDNTGGGTLNPEDFNLHVQGQDFNDDGTGTTLTLTPGAFVVSEDDYSPAYTTQFSAGCTGTAEGGDVLECTVTNSFVPPTIKVTKVVVGGSLTAGDFNLHVQGQDFSDDGSGTVLTLNVGAYEVTEDDYSSTYDTTFEGDCSGTAQGGDVLECTITNSRKAQVKVVKELTPNTDGGLFDLQINGLTELADAGDGDDTGFVSVDNLSGNSVGETAGTATALPDYISTIACDNGDAGAGTSLSLSDLNYGDQVTCTISNTKRASLTITKTAAPADGTDFDFTIEGPTDLSPFVNEFHYDNDGTDTGEFFEVAGAAGTDLSGWSVVLYNGANGQSYDTINLSGTIDDEGSGFGAVDFQLPTNGLQNGAPDGMALVDPSNNVVQFISYEGSFTASNGPAAGLTSTDVGVAETASTPVGESLQLTGTGSTAADFTWSGPATASPGGLNSGQTLTFQTSTTFTLDDEPVQPNDSVEQSITFDHLTPGDYTISEELLAGWELDGVTCTGGSGDFYDLTGESLAVTLGAGENIECAFTNEKDAFILVDKVTDPAGDPESFDFSTTGVGYASFSLTDGDPANNSGDLDPGTYSVSEDAEAGWDLTSATCVSSIGDSETPGGIELDAGETVTCTFENTKNGKIIVEKQTLPDGDPATFDFSGDIVDTLSDGDTAELEVAPGTYSLVETVPAGWDLTNIECDDTDSSGDTTTATATFNVDPGEEVTCTFTNSKRGTIRIVKHIVPDNASGTFNFESADFGNFSLTFDFDFEEFSVPYSADAVSYVFEEVATPGWELTSVVCDDATFDSEAVGPTLTVKVTGGESVRCIFTNDPLPDISVQKDNDANGDTIFSDTEQAPAGGASVTFQVQITNNTDEDVTIDSISDDTHNLTGSNCASLVGTTLAANQTVTCTFSGTIADDDDLSEVNEVTVEVSDDDGNGDEASDTSTVTTPDIQPDITVEKRNDADGDTAFGDNEQTSPGATVTFQVKITNNTNEEVFIASISDDTHDLTGSDCANQVGVILAGNSSVTCTFSGAIANQFNLVEVNEVTVGVKDDEGNTAEAKDTSTVTTFGPVSITIIKQATPEGKKEFNFSGTLGNFSLVDDGAGPGQDTISFPDLLPGSYTLGEAAPGGNWSLLSIVCQSNSTQRQPNPFFVSFPETEISFELLTAENIICTFTNEKANAEEHQYYLPIIVK